MSQEELSPEEAAHLAEQAKQADLGIPKSGYDELDGEESPFESDDKRPEDGPGKPEAITAFLVYITAEGKAIATTQIQEALDQFTIRREAELPDFLRACQEIANDCNTATIAQSVLELQMQMSRQAMQAAQNQQMLQGLDLSKVK